MKEILIPVILIVILLVVFRGVPRTSEAPPPATTRVRLPTAAELEEERRKSSRRRRLRWLGGAFLVIGLVMLAYSFKLLDFLITGYSLAAVIIIAGIIILVLSMRR